MEFDVMVCTDCWWNLPRVIAHRILQHPTADKVSCNTYDPDKFPIRHNLTGIKPMSDMKEFMRIYGKIKTIEQRPANVLIAGQGWNCGTHNETLGVRALSKFVPNRLRIFVDTQLVARVTQELDRTTAATDMHDDHDFTWKHVDGTLYEMQGIKNAW
jgi:hypothetical protein